MAAATRAGRRRGLPAGPFPARVGQLLTPARRCADPTTAVQHPHRVGKHQFAAAGQNFVVDSRYVPKANLGTGAYGVVM